MNPPPPLQRHQARCQECGRAYLIRSGSCRACNGICSRCGKPFKRDSATKEVCDECMPRLKFRRVNEKSIAAACGIS